jgi:hypothetical protein
MARCPNGGTYVTDALDALIAEGAPSLSELPYNDTQGPQTPQAGDQSYRYRIGGYQRLFPFTRTKAREAIAAGYPIVFNGTLPGNFYTDPYSRSRAVRTRVFRGMGNCQDSAHCGGHAMTIVGYDDRIGAYRVLNSWGADFGELGHLWWDYANLESYSPEAYAVMPLPGAPQPFVMPDRAAFSTELAVTGGAVLARAADGWWTLAFRLRLREPARLRTIRITPLNATTPATEQYSQWISYGNVTFGFSKQSTAGMARVEMDFTLFDNTQVQVVRTVEIPAPESDPDGMD